MSSNRTWDHAITPLAGERYRTTCVVAKCANKPTHLAVYRYVTGKSGRTTKTLRELCDFHAQNFATKHGLAVGVTS